MKPLQKKRRPKMEAFDSWDEEYCKRFKEGCPPLTLEAAGCGACTRLRRDGWREAVKWALDLYLHKGNNPELFQELIEKEIKDDH